MQTAHHGSFDTYLRDLDSMDLVESLGQVQVSMTATDDGWMAVASVEKFLTKCVVFDGRIEAPHSSVVARTPTYLSPHELQEAIGWLATSVGKGTPPN
ncbi:MAG: hypothetical protein ACC682_16570, partial [Gemmatimonadota bacterium]